jgi:hypothetical protein
MKGTVATSYRGMIYMYIQNFKRIGAAVQSMRSIKVLPQEFERL